MLGDKKMQHAWMKYAEFNDIPHDHEDEEPFKQGFAMGRTDSDQLAELATLKAKLAAVREIVAEYANPEAHIYVDEHGKEIMRDDFGHVRAANALTIIDGTTPSNSMELEGKDA